MGTKQWNLVALAILGWASGCESIKKADDSAVEIGRVQAPLELAVTSPFYLETFPAIHETSPQNGTAFGCTAQDCLVIYGESPAGHPSILATRIAPDGKLIDVPRLLLDQLPKGGFAVPVGVAAHGSEYLAVWTDGSSSTAPRSRAATIAAGNGNVDGGGGTVTDVTAAMPSGTVTGLWTTGSSFLVTFDKKGSDAGIVSYAVVLDPSNLSPVGQAIPLPLGTPRVVPGSGQYLLLWQGKAQRLDETTGAFLDASAFVFSSFVVGAFAGTYDQGVYYLSTVTGSAPLAGQPNSIYGTRIQASDGTVRDPDNTFNQIPGPKLLCDKCVNAVVGVTTAHVLNSQIVVTWYDSTGGHGVRLSPTDGLRVDGKTTPAEFNMGSQFPVSFEMLSATKGVGLNNSNGVSTVTYAASSPPILTGAQAHSLGIAGDDRVHPAVAASSSDFLVAWLSADKVRATHVSASTGAYLDDPALDLGALTTAGAPPPQLASKGSDYMVAWLTSTTLERRIVHADGSDAGVTFPAPFSIGGAAESLRLVSNGKYYLAAWYRSLGVGALNQTAQAIRMAADGSAVDKTPVVLGTGLTTHYVSAAADMPQDVTTSTFVGAWTSSSTSSQYRLFRSELGVLINPIGTAALGTDPLLATGGIQMLMVGNLGQAALVYPSKDPLSGALGTVAPLPGLPLNQGFALHKLAFDGKSYLVGMLKAGAFIKRYASDLTPLDGALPQGTQIVDRLDESTFDMAGNGSGRTLFVYSNDDVARAGYAITGRFIDDDGLPAPSPPDAGAGGRADGSAGGGGSPAGGASNGGSPSNGGASSGGASSGGTSSGGTSSGGASSGGASSGGASSGGASSGGASSGGTAGSGGTSNGGASSGGASGSGATAGSGGLGGMGGAKSTGGSGRDGAAGPVVEDSAVFNSNQDKGCGCAVPGRSPEAPWWTLSLVAALAVARRRRAARGRARGYPLSTH